MARLIFEMGWHKVAWLVIEDESYGNFFSDRVPLTLDDPDSHSVFTLSRQTLRSPEDWQSFNLTTVQKDIQKYFPTNRLWHRVIAYIADERLLYLVYLKELLQYSVIRRESVMLHAENLCDMTLYGFDLPDFLAVDDTYFSDPYWQDPASYLHGSLCTSPDSSSDWIAPNSRFLAWLPTVSRQVLDAVGTPSDWSIPSVEEWLSSGYRPLIMDTMFAVIMSIGQLLHDGVDESEIQGRRLYETMLRAQFPGISGNVSFTADGERLGTFVVKNMQLLESGTALVPVLRYTEIAGGNVSLPGYRQSLFMSIRDIIFRNNRSTLGDALLCDEGYEPTITEDAGLGRIEWCSACKAGYFKGWQLGADAACIMCPRTRFTNRTGQIACQYCPPGRYGDGFGATECTLCPPGRSQETIAQSDCYACALGSYAPEAGQRFCDPCPRGTFQEDTGQSQCQRCPNETTTQDRNSRSASDCACPPDTYFENGGCPAAPAGRTCEFGSVLDNCTCLPLHRNSGTSDATCLLCEEHLSCPGGHPALLRDQPDTTVLVEENYMTLPEDPYSVYECLSDTVCPGLRSPFNSTDPGRICVEGVKLLARCGRCVDNSFGSLYGTAEDGCSQCPPKNHLLTFAKGMAAFGSNFALVVYLYARFNMPNPAAFITISLMISVVQSLQTFGQLQLNWPKVLVVCFDFINMFFTSQGFLTVLELRIECSAGNEFIWELIRQVVSPLIVFVDFIVLYPLAKLVRRPLRWDFVHNIIGLIYTRLFIGIVRLSLVLFYRLIMPNKKVMVAEVPELEFLSTQWWEVMPVGVIATLVYASSTVGYVTYLVITAPKQAAVDPNFMARARFCFGSMRPDRHWWILVQLLYAFAVNFSQVATPSSNVHFKLYMTMFSLIVFVIVAYNCEPFKFAENNHVDILFNCLLVMLLVLATSFVDSSSFSADELQRWNNIYAYSILVFFVLAFLWACSHVVRFFFSKVVERKGFSEGKRAQFGWEFRDCTVAMLLMPDKELLRRLSNLGDYDLYNLKHATKTMVQVLLGAQTSKWSWKQRVMPGEQFHLWNYHDMQLQACEQIGTGFFAQKVAQSYRVRAWVLQMAMQLSEVHSSFESTTSPHLFPHTTSPHLFVQATTLTEGLTALQQAGPLGRLGSVDRLIAAFGIDDKTPATRAHFRGMVRKSFPDLKISGSDIEELFNILDQHGTGEVVKSDVVLTINALLPKSFLETLHESDVAHLEEAIDGKTSGDTGTPTNVMCRTGGARKHVLRQALTRLLSEDPTPSESQKVSFALNSERSASQAASARNLSAPASMEEDYQNAPQEASAENLEKLLEALAKEDPKLMSV